MSSNNSKSVMAFNMVTRETIFADSIVEMGVKLGEHLKTKPIPESTIRSSMKRNTDFHDFAIIPMYF